MLDHRAAGRPSSRRAFLVGTLVLLVVALLGASAVTSGAVVARAVPASAAQAPACSSGTTVATDAGQLCGTTGGAVTTWLGVPYAQPPAGALRWAPPQQYARWAGVRPATSFGSECVQPGANGGLAGSEDCLFLNITAPRSATAGSGLPVVVNLHPGGFFAGSGDGDFARLATSGPQVVVSVNYRLGILGFLANRSLGAHPGDYGLLDQQAALRWVRMNIGAFGGDANRVTLIGESAGGESVCHQLASPTASGLFQRAVSYSGFPNSADNRSTGDASSTRLESQDCKVALPDETTATAQGADFAAAVHCTGANAPGCLRATPVADLMQAAGSGYQFSGGHGTTAPTLAAGVLPKTFLSAVADGTVNKVPTVIGVARDENLAGAPTTTDGYLNLLRAQYGDDWSAIAGQYPVSRFGNPFIAWRTVAADSNTVCPALATEKMLSTRTRTYAFEMDDGQAAPQAFDVPGQPNGSSHIADWYLFTAAGVFAAPTTDDQKALRDQELAEISALAATGQSATSGAPVWPSFDQGAQVLSLAPGADSQLLPAATLSTIHHCSFWSAHS